MKIGKKGENLIFLVSVPRSGSTLLQQMLSSNPEVHTLPEPWIALPSLYTLYSRKIDRRHNTEYNLYWARTAVKGFIDHLPGGEETYLEGIRKLYVHLYGKAVEGTGKRVFLDKGPRYFLIIPELLKVFPRAGYVFLLRNPLAVLVSIFNKWGRGRYEVFSQFKHDLLRGVWRIVKDARLCGDNAAIVKYEDLLKDPENTLKEICSVAGLDYDPAMLSYSERTGFADSLGYKEQKERYKSGNADRNNISEWEKHLKDPQLWRAADDYLRFLGRERLDKMGYPFDGLIETLDKYYPGRFRLLGTRSFFQCIKDGNVEYKLKGQDLRGFKGAVKKFKAYIAE